MCLILVGSFVLPNTNTGSDDTLIPYMMSFDELLMWVLMLLPVLFWSLCLGITKTYLHLTKYNGSSFKRKMTGEQNDLRAGN